MFPLLERVVESGSAFFPARTRSIPASDRKSSSPESKNSRTSDPPNASRWRATARCTRTDAPPHRRASVGIQNALRLRPSRRHCSVARPVGRDLRHDRTRSARHFPESLDVGTAVHRDLLESRGRDARESRQRPSCTRKVGHVLVNVNRATQEKKLAGIRARIRGLHGHIRSVAVTEEIQPLEGALFNPLT